LSAAAVVTEYFTQFAELNDQRNRDRRVRRREVRDVALHAIDIHFEILLRQTGGDLARLLVVDDRIDINDVRADFDCLSVLAGDVGRQRLLLLLFFVTLFLSLRGTLIFLFVRSRRDAALLRDA